MVVRQFFWYLWLVFRRTLSGVFIVVDLLGVLLILLSINQPSIPIFVSIGVFVLIWMVSSYLVWKDITTEKAELVIKIKNMESQIPRYTVSTGPIEKFSIDEIIGSAVDDLDDVKKRRETEAKAKDSAIGMGFGGLSNLVVNLPRSLRGETLEEKEDRLLGYVGELAAFEELLAKMHKVPLYFEVTRADENVEFTVEVEPRSKLVVSDDYEKKNLPSSYEPSLYGAIGPIHSLPVTGLANRLYPYSYAEKGVGYSKLTKINASQKYNLFDEDFYISTDADEVELTITVHSGKINNPQVIKRKLDFRGIKPQQVVFRDEDDDE